MKKISTANKENKVSTPMTIRDNIFHNLLEDVLVVLININPLQINVAISNRNNVPSDSVKYAITVIITIGGSQHNQNVIAKLNFPCNMAWKPILACSSLSC
ncbi:TPA: hypothetical protein ACXN4M_001048 [Proteus mirabilis]